MIKLKNFLAATLLAALFSTITLQAQTSAMVGSTDMRETNILTVTRGEFPKGGLSCEVSDKSGKRAFEPVKIERVNDAKVSRFQIFGLSPNTEYTFKIVSANGAKTETEGKFKTSPDYLERYPVPDFSFAVIGNQYVNEKEFDPPYRTNGGNYEIFDTIKKNHPAFVVWADNLDTLRPADRGSKSGIFGRYLNAHTQPQLASFLASQANYGVMGARSFGAPNDDAATANKKDAQAAFKTFWANPIDAVDGVHAYTFSYADAQFFIVDDCSEKYLLDYKKDFPSFLGEKQMFWLKSALQNSTAKFKIVVINSPTANPVASKSNFKFSRERDELIAFLTDKKIGGVIFVSANKDYGEITRMVRAGAYPLVDITVPPVTGRPAKETEELNYFRIPNSGIFARGFALVSVEGKENARIITVSFVSADGSRTFSLSIKESELYSFK